MDTSSPEHILEQVEALFSAIELLPPNMRGEALKKIHTKLEIQSNESEYTRDIAQKGAEMDVEVKEVDKSDQNADTTVLSENGEVADGDLLSPNKMDYSNKKTAVPNSRIKKTNAGLRQSLPPSKRIVLKRNTNENEQNGESAEQMYQLDDSDQSDNDKETEHEITLKSRRKRRIPKRLQTDEEKESGASENGENKSVADDAADKVNGIPINVYSIPTGIKARYISQPIDAASNVIASSKGGRRKRVKGQTTLYGCTICDKKFSSRSLVIVHMRTHTGERPYACSICNKSFTQRGSLSVHMKRHQGVQDFFCPHCDYKSLGKIDMIRHIARHRGEKNYFCEICGKRFVAEPSLKDHIKNVHERCETFICQICGFVTHRADNLRRHLTVRHSNKEYVQCPVCHEVIKQRSSFITHMRTHTGERPLTCPKCGKTFRNHSQVAAHMRSHGDGTFECDQCHRRFKTKFHLRRHSLVHTGEKPYSCMYCMYSCNVKGNINKHIKMVHGIKDFSFRKINGSKKNIDELFEQPEIDQLKEKGEAMAKEFLTKLSSRKNEQLTVEALQQALEEKKRQDENDDDVDGSHKRRRSKTKKGRVRHDDTNNTSVDITTISGQSHVLVELNEGASCSTDENIFHEIHIENIAEEEVIGIEGNIANYNSDCSPTTIIIPSNGYICVQPDMDLDSTAVPVSLITADGEKVAPTTVYFIQCNDEDDEEESIQQ